MRQFRSAALLAGLAAAAALAGCAGGPMQDSYLSRTEKLAADCEARGGILAATGGQSGRPETDHVCQITGAASRLPPRT